MKPESIADSSEWQSLSANAGNTLLRLKELLALSSIAPDGEVMNDPPNNLAICIAAKAIVDIGAQGLKVTAVNIDAIGGVAVYFDLAEKEQAWLCVTNGGDVSCINMRTLKKVGL